MSHFTRILFILMVVALVPLGSEAQTVTTLLQNGPRSSKINLVIIGDGFRAGTDQTMYNNFVRNTVIRDLFDENRDGAYREIMGALFCLVPGKMGSLRFAAGHEVRHEAFRRGHWRSLSPARAGESAGP